MSGPCTVISISAMSLLVQLKGIIKGDTAPVIKSIDKNTQPNVIFLSPPAQLSAVVMIYLLV